MSIATSEPPATQSTKGEQRVVLRCISWDAYVQLLGLLPQSRGARLTYDQGVLEITMPLEDHEFFRCLIERFIIVLVELLNLPIKTMGSTTLNYPPLQRGAEPDNAYYIQNQPLVKGRNVDFASDPPPDLVVEVDITHTDIAKNQFYAALGVPEFWRFNGEVWRIYSLQEGGYVEVDYSPTFSQVPKEWLYDFLVMAKEDEVGAMRELRERWRACFGES
ncbi:Uma2 family endonuclease [Spirulina subsalsa FACHB-351]|uniref:Uma2 family endonuclease n=1 Tax=Spirulina subsalsa FACHB-351 TaxID=234711 RepID=A0ABT3L5M8_9CYAN|nr:Uma2 family endonuclease [Spirulina subsalsa]MCW6036752.1 Uma2 family endonuclease [Spirulina subsalsa FACHB-351]